jgi:hypothetical protein
MQHPILMYGLSVYGLFAAAFIYLWYRLCRKNAQAPKVHIFDAEPLHSSGGHSSVEAGWLIEKRPALYGGAPQWLIASWTFEWTTDSAKAIRFCRREDAEQIASMLESEEVSITEHQWGS